MEDKVRGLLARYHDHELSEEAAREVELHVAGCATCRAELADLRSLSAALSLAAAPPALPVEPQAFWENLQPRLGPQRAGPPWTSWLPGLLLLALMGLLLAAAPLLALGSALGSLTGLNVHLPGLALPLLPLPGAPLPLIPLPDGAQRVLLSLCVVGAVGVLYLIWLAAWWSRSRAVAQSINA